MLDHRLIYEVIIMPSKADRQAAFAICAAIIGAGFASGREIVSFFSCFGAASWLGVAAASAGIGALVYAVMLLSRRTQAETFPDLYGKLMGEPCKDAMHILHGLLCLITTSAMLAAGAELGALTFPIRHSYALGFALTLCAGLAAVCTGFQALSTMGVLLVPFIACYFAAMALNGQYAPSFLLDGLLPAIPMGLIYASFNGALAGGAICLAGQKEADPARTALLTGTLMLFLLSCANWAMLRAGEAIRQMALPSIVLTAEWGVFGYYASIFILWLAILTTLCAMLHSMQAQLKSIHIKKLPSLCLSAGIASLLAVAGFQSLVNTMYPLLGWICGFALVALMLFLPDKEGSSSSKSQ